jgi:hypothetical protein
MIVRSFFICFLIFPTIFFVSFPNSLNVSLEQATANEDVMNLFRTNVSTPEDEITDGVGGDAIGGGTGRARGGDGGDGGDAIGGGTGRARGGDGGDGGDAIGGGTGTARGGDGGDGGDAIGTPSCSEVIGGDGGYGGTAAAGTDVEVGQEGEKGENGYCEVSNPNES